jgi:hypothetical protein
VSYGRGGAWQQKWKRLKKSGGGKGLHNKPIGCGASGAYAPGPDDEEEGSIRAFFLYTGGPPYPQIIRSKTYRSYVKLQIIPNAMYNVI